MATRDQGQRDSTDHAFQFLIKNELYGSLYETKIELKKDKDLNFKLKIPLEIVKDNPYRIIMKSKTLWLPRYTYGANIPQEALLFSPSLKIRFEKIQIANNVNNCSLISGLTFKHPHD